MMTDEERERKRCELAAHDFINRMESPILPMELADLLERERSLVREEMLVRHEKVTSALAAGLEPFAHFSRQWDRQPLRGRADEMIGIHSGTEFEAMLRLSDCRHADELLKTTEVGSVVTSKEMERWWAVVDRAEIVLRDMWRHHAALIAALDALPTRPPVKP